MVNYRARSTLFAVILAALVAPACGGVDNAIHVDGIRQTLAATPDWVDRGALGERLWEFEQAFYEQRAYLPAWVDGDRTTQQMKDLLQALRDSELHGLEPTTYAVDEFERTREASQTRFRGTRFEPAAVPELDARMTYAYLRHAADLLGWSRRPRDVFAQWEAAPLDEDLARRLARAIDSNQVRQTLEELVPEHPQYTGLQAALARERERERERERGGADVERIRMNLERWRWLPRDLGDRYILINVPAYMLQVMAGDTPALAMRVIVGQSQTPTPLFSDVMTNIVFSPYWNIPESILREETLPRAARDPDFLARNNIEVVAPSGSQPVGLWEIDWSDEAATEGLRFRQRPGPQNALGLVKFIFPNHFSVYLHDTPGDRLFSREKRTFSHGCIRVEDPVALAKHVLADQAEWTETRITRAMHAGREQTVMLKEPLPVHIGYWTAWVAADGSVSFTDDPYGIDRTHARLRARSAPQDVASN